MKALGWKDEYALGIPAVDLQHQRMFDCIAGMATTGPNPLVGAPAACSIVQFADLLRQHFSLEEHMMRSLHYPALDSHIEQHRQFQADVDELGKTSPVSPGGVAHETIAGFQAWQREHVATSDRLYVEFFLGPRHQRAGRKPAAT
jgi:hemerythrin-like metal-binding protein